MLNAQEIRFILDQLREATIVEPNDRFPYRITAQQIGYSPDPFVGGLQAKLSIMLEVAHARERSPVRTPETNVATDSALWEGVAVLEAARVGRRPLTLSERLRQIVDDDIEHEGVALTCEVVEQFNGQYPYQTLSVEEANRQIEEFGAYEFRDGADSCGAWVRR